VDDRRVDPDTGARQQFQSVILPRWCRRSPKVAEVLPLLYLHGLSSSDFVPALTELFGGAAGLSASVISRLTTQWQAEREAFQQRDLQGVDYVDCWADGVVRHEAPLNRAGCKGPLVVCRSRPPKLRAA
jgi:putative transposase